MRILKEFHPDGTRNRTIAIVTILCLAISIEDDAKAIRGEWRCTSLNLDGEQVKLSVAKYLRLTLDADVYLEEANGKELQRLKYRLLPGGIIRFDAPSTWFLGRYELTARKLRLCYPGLVDDDGKPHPPELFDAAKGVTLSTWERD